MHRLFVLLAVLFTFALPAPAGAQPPTGTLSGTIHDTTGAVLPGVNVTIRNVATGAARSVVSDGEGRYRIVNVDPGNYELRAQLNGFRTVIRNPVVISVGGMAQSDIEMSVGALAEAVTVQTEAPLIEPSKTDLSRVVTTQEIESLPIAGRNFVDFVKLSSGVALGRENVGGGSFK